MFSCQNNLALNLLVPLVSFEHVVGHHDFLLLCFGSLHIDCTHDLVILGHLETIVLNVSLNFVPLTVDVRSRFINLLPVLLQKTPASSLPCLRGCQTILGGHEVGFNEKSQSIADFDAQLL